MEFVPARRPPRPSNMLLAMSFLLPAILWICIYLCFMWPTRHTRVNVNTISILSTFLQSLPETYDLQMILRDTTRDYARGLLNWNTIPNILLRKTTPYLRYKLPLIDPVKDQAPNLYTMDTQTSYIAGTRLFYWTVARNIETILDGLRKSLGREMQSTESYTLFASTLWYQQELYDYLRVSDLVLRRVRNSAAAARRFLIYYTLMKIDCNRKQNLICVQVE